MCLNTSLQLVVLFGLVLPLGGGALLEEVHPWGGLWGL